MQYCLKNTNVFVEKCAKVCNCPKKPKKPNVLQTMANVCEEGVVAVAPDLL